jgi:hypothetical protein
MATEQVNFNNLFQVLKDKAVYYEESMQALKNLLLEEATIENVSKLKSNKVQEIATDIGVDLSILAKARIECVGSPYYSDRINEFIFYLKDVLSAVRLYNDARGAL